MRAAGETESIRLTSKYERKKAQQKNKKEAHGICEHTQKSFLLHWSILPLAPVYTRYINRAFGGDCTAVSSTTMYIPIARQEQESYLLHGVLCNDLTDRVSLPAPRVVHGCEFLGRQRWCPIFFLLRSLYKGSSTMQSCVLFEVQRRLRIRLCRNERRIGNHRSRGYYRIASACTTF
jgi:hypothetical protein